MFPSHPVLNLDYSKTQRILLLIDLNHRLHHHHINTLLSLSTTLLSFPPLSTSLFSFRLLSPLSPPLLSPLSFNPPSTTLSSLSTSLSSLSTTTTTTTSTTSPSLLSSTISTFLHHYPWDPHHPNSNLILLFSPISPLHLPHFTPTGTFPSLRDSLLSKNIHFTWVDININININPEIDYSSDDEYQRLACLFRLKVRSLGWGFCSSNSILLGSALVPFALIYPLIGVGVSSILSDYSEIGTVQLGLEIDDVNGSPLQCKFCDLQLLRFNKALRVEGNNDCENGVVKIDVKGVCKDSEGVMGIEGNALDMVLVREFRIDEKKKKEELEEGFFADRVVEMLLNEMSKFRKRKSRPHWGILLSFLCRKGYCALVSLSNVDGSTQMGVLKPFTIDTAFLFVMKNGIDKLNSVGMASVDGIVGDENRRKNKKKHPYRYKDLDWSSFCKAAYERCEMELEEAYFSKGCDSSKKLKFLKCWMKQAVKKGSSYVSKIRSQDGVQNEEGSSLLCQKTEQQLSSSVGESGGKEKLLEERTVPVPEAAEAFFSNLSERIQHGIETGVDLVAFAKRVVFSCICWLSKKLETSTTNEERRVSIGKSDCSNSEGLVAGELIKLLLKDPKDLVGKNQDNDPSSKVCEAKPSNNASKDRVREYELQIMFRMEILQSQVAVGIRESTKHKFVKQICSLLEFIQCNMEDGFFGDFSLNNYVGRALGSRYSQSLAGVVHRIYEQMDLLLFVDEDESPNPLLNSEESSQSWRVLDNDRGCEPNSTEDSFSGPLRCNGRKQKDNGKVDLERKLVEAQERRERASRFASFSRRAMPELQRVWAPKPPKLSRSKSDSFRKCKRKSRQKGSYDMVCETPVSGAKRCLFPSEKSVGDQQYRGPGAGSSLSGSVHKALFQEESHHDWSP